MQRSGLPPVVEPLAALTALVLSIVAGALAGARFGPALGAAAGLLVAVALYVSLAFRSLRRRFLASRPFPESMRTTLVERVAFYRRLAPEDKARFENEVRWFLDEQTITGPRHREVPEHLRVLVAASAVILVFGRTGFRYPKLRDVVVYDRAFDHEYNEGARKPILGMVHGQGPILLSAESLEDGFEHAKDGLNVGLHEFAHVLDFDVGQADGVPSFMPWKNVGPWLELMRAEARRIERKRSILRRYATTNEAEFFAVATEAFFERPHAMRDKHPELYELLKDTFGQDPAARRETITP